MKKIETLKKKLVKISSTVLPALAVAFALAPCICRMYEPEMPEELKR